MLLPHPILSLLSFWTGNLDTLNENFGDDSELKGLVSAVHSREMLFLLDINVNNMGSNSTPTNVSWLMPFMNESNYHAQCSTPYKLPCSSFSDDEQWALENCWIQDGSFSLPDINTENQTLVDMLNTWVNQTVQTYNIDGLHVLNTPNIRRDFWPAFIANASTFTLAQINTTDPGYASRYTGLLDTVQNYPMYYALKNAFATQIENATSGNLYEVIKLLNASQQMYSSGAFGSTIFTEGVDVPRLPSLTNGDTSLVKNALAFTFAGDSIPVLYYGQEIGLTGSLDAGVLNHEPLWLSGTIQSGDEKPTGILVDFITSMNHARKISYKAHPNFYDNAVKAIVPTNSSTIHKINSTSTQNEIYTSVALYKYPMLTLISAGGNKTTPSWDIPGSALTSDSIPGYGSNQMLVDVLSCNVIITDQDGGISTKSKDGEPLVLLPHDMLADSNTCGVEKPATDETISGAMVSASISGWVKMLFTLGVGMLLTVT